jgi:hypothetical protein
LNAKRARAGRPVLINAGSGARGGGWLPHLFDGWEHVRVDVDPAVRPDLVASLIDLSAVPSASAAGLCLCRPSANPEEREAAMARRDL